MFRWKRIAWMSAAAVLAVASGYAQLAEPAAMAFVDARGDERTESTYQKGTTALDQKQWDRALELFGSIPNSSPRADGALYWKAYALNKLGRRPEALETISQLQRRFPASRWVNDAKALEVEVRQAEGRPVSPDAEPDADLKLMAINSLMHTDPERAIPLLEKILKGNQPARYKERALFVLLQTGSPRARQIVGDVARNNANPELQMKAIQNLGVMGGPESLQILAEVYTSATDVQVKRHILQSFMVAGDRGRLLAAAKSESNPELRRTAIQQLGVMGKQTAPDLLTLYATAHEKSERKAVVQALFVQGNAMALVDLARKENDPELKRAIVQQLSIMNTKEATDYMMEILNK